MWACKINLELLYSSHFNSRFLFYIIITFVFFITFPFLLFSLLSISSFRVHLLSNLSFIAFHILLPYLLFIYFLSNLRFICFLSFFVVYILPFLFAIRKIPLCLHRSSLQLKVSYTSYLSDPSTSNRRLYIRDLHFKETNSVRNIGSRDMKAHQVVTYCFRKLWHLWMNV